MDSEFKRSMAPSLALLTLASLTPKEHQVVIEDENINKLDYKRNYDLIGISVNVDTSTRAYQIAINYKKRKIPVILGGIHVSANPDEALKYADSVCIGEAENVWSDILNDVSKGKLKNKYKSDVPVDLSQSPIIQKDLLKSSKYLYTNILYTSRGCPFSCDFCYNSCEYVQKLFRNRSITKIINEIQTFPTSQVMFIDDNFIGNISWTKKFLNSIKYLNLTWHAAVSTNLVNHISVLDDMAISGCKSLFIGFESINKKSINHAHKYQNKINKFDKLIKEIHDRGIMVNASLVFGFDYDYPDIFQKTLEWLLYNKIDTVTAHILTPYPGTKLFNRLKEEDRIISFDWSLYNTSNVVFIPKNMTKEELYEGYRSVYKQFYSFKNILNRMPIDKKQRIAFLLFNLGYRKYGKIFSHFGRIGFMGQIGRIASYLSYRIN